MSKLSVTGLVLLFLGAAARSHATGPDCSGGEIYDGGVAQSGIVTAGLPNVGYAQLFQPPTAPYRYTAVCISIYGPDPDLTLTDATFYFISANGTDGAPGTYLGSVTRTITHIPNDRSFVRVDFGLDAPFLESANPVYIALAFDTSTNPAFNIGVDTSDATPFHASYSSDDLSNWTAIASQFAGMKSFLFRAEGEEACSELVQGYLDGSSPKFNPGSTNEVSLTCEALMVDSIHDDVPYNAIPISSPTGGTFIAQTIGVSTLDDTMITLYCDPFDPENPLSNVIAFDDDDGAGGLSQFTASRNITLQANTRYWLVVSKFSSGIPDGTYELCLGNGFKRDTVCTKTVSGTLDASSPHYNRIVGAEHVASSCNITNVDSPQNNMPYAAIPFYVKSTGYFEAHVMPEGTSIQDTVMTVYCDPFDPENPGTNVAAYNDNGGPGKFSQFINSDALKLPVGVYWLVLTTWDGDDADGGDFEICMSGDINAQYPLAYCAEDSLFGQAPGSPFGVGVARQETTNSPYKVDTEDFSGLSAPIGRVDWWGVQIGCADEVMDFQITFYADAAGMPSTQVYQQQVTPVKANDSYDWSTNIPLIHFSATISPPLDLATGWVRILGVPTDSCVYSWDTTPDGNDHSVQADLNGQNATTSSYNYAMCLSGAAPTQHTADENGDHVISLSELLRVIQFYNSNGLHCNAASEDGFDPGPGLQTCAHHDSDYNPANWIISLSELLRVIQFYNSLAYHVCGDGEDGFCPGV